MKRELKKAMIAMMKGYEQSLLDRACSSERFHDDVFKNVEETDCVELSRDPNQVKIIATGEKYKVGDTYCVWDDAPGTGRTLYEITRIDESGIYGRKVSSEVE